MFIYTHIYVIHYILYIFNIRSSESEGVVKSRTLTVTVESRKARPSHASSLAFTWINQPTNRSATTQPVIIGNHEPCKLKPCNNALAFSTHSTSMIYLTNKSFTTTLPVYQINPIDIQFLFYSSAFRFFKQLLFFFFLFNAVL